MKNQYERLAETEIWASEAVANVATYHDRLADGMGHLPVVTKQPNPQDSAFRR
jgi:hypothetical protein